MRHGFCFSDRQSHLVRKGAPFPAPKKIFKKNLSFLLRCRKVKYERVSDGRMIAMAIISSNDAGQSVSGTLVDVSSHATNDAGQSLSGTLADVNLHPTSPTDSNEHPSKTNQVSDSRNDKTLQSHDEKKVKEAAKKISDFIKTTTRELELTVGNVHKKITIKVKVKSSGEVIVEIPSDKALEIADSLNTVSGLLIRKYV